MFQFHGLISTFSSQNHFLGFNYSQQHACGISFCKSNLTMITKQYTLAAIYLFYIHGHLLEVERHLYSDASKIELDLY